MKDKKVLKLTYASVMTSLALVIDLIFKAIPLMDMPRGGSITISMLPLVIVAYACGWKYGLGAGITFGVLSCFVIDGYGFNAISFVLDYVIGFGSVAIAGLFSKKALKGNKLYFFFGFLLAAFIRWISSGFSGVLNAGIWGYDGVFLEGVFGAGKGGTLYLYIFSFIIYNFPYIFLSAGISAILGILIYPQFVKLNFE